MQMNLDYLLISLQEDTHANHLATPGSEEARKMTATYGRKLIGPQIPEMIGYAILEAERVVST